MVDATSANSSPSSSSNNAALDTNIEISRLVLPQLDRHLALSLVQFLEDNDVYPRNDLLQAKRELLSATNMLPYLDSVRKDIGEDVNETETQGKLADLSLKRDELKEKADRVIEILADPNVATALGQDKERNLTTLREKYNVGALTARVARLADWLFSAAQRRAN